MKKKKAFQKLLEFMAHLTEHKCLYSIAFDSFGLPVLSSTMHDGVRLVALQISLNQMDADRSFVFFACMHYELGPEAREDDEEITEWGSDLYDLLSELRIQYLLEFDPKHPAVQDDDESDEDIC